MKDTIAQDVIDNFHINYFDTSTTLVKYTQKLNLWALHIIFLFEFLELGRIISSLIFYYINLVSVCVSV